MLVFKGDMRKHFQNFDKFSYDDQLEFASEKKFDSFADLQVITMMVRELGISHWSKSWDFRDWLEDSENWFRDRKTLKEAQEKLKNYMDEIQQIYMEPQNSTKSTKNHRRELIQKGLTPIGRWRHDNELEVWDHKPFEESVKNLYILYQHTCIWGCYILQTAFALLAFRRSCATSCTRMKELLFSKKFIP